MNVNVLKIFLFNLRLSVKIEYREFKLLLHYKNTNNVSVKSLHRYFN